LAGQSTSFGSTGVKPITVSGSFQSASATDEMVAEIATNPSMASQIYGFKLSQNIDTPVTQGGGGGGTSGADWPSFSGHANFWGWRYASSVMALMPGIIPALLRLLTAYG
jgi:hypothetical protein